MHADQLFCDRMLQLILLLRQPLYSPDLRKELGDLLLDVVLLGHGFWNCLRTQRYFVSWPSRGLIDNNEGVM